MNIEYPGKELELFSKAKNWKRYFGGIIEPFIKGDVLEIGAGIGETTKHLHNDNVKSWTAVEPDKNFYDLLLQKKAKGEFPFIMEIVEGTIDSVGQEKTFDTILYIDVLEHIEQDRDEIMKAKNRLAYGGHLVVLSPSFQSVYSAFDKAIGHFRRYTKKTLREAAYGSGLKEEKMIYAESMGLLLLFVNRFFAREKYPTEKQIALWDSVIVPASKISDRILMRSFGKTIIGVWKKTGHSLPAQGIQ